MSVREAKIKLKDCYPTVRLLHHRKCFRLRYCYVVI